MKKLMVGIDNEEPDPFLQKKEWKAFQEMRRKIEESSPEYKKRQERIRILSRLVSFMIYPDGPYRCGAIRRETTGRLVQFDSNGRVTPPDTISKQIKPYGLYSNNQDFHLFCALRKYCSEFPTGTVSVQEEMNNLLDLDHGSQDLINEASELARWPYKLGAALYIHQQMIYLKLCPEPSQGKAQWLVAKAPLRRPEDDNVIRLRPDGGEPSKIGDQWKKYYSVAHFWAAFVVWTKTPLCIPDDRFVLLDFIRNADVSKFLETAALFRKFRVDVDVTRSKGISLIKQFGNRDDKVLEGFELKPDYSIENLLETWQWDVLKKYKTRPRLNRSTHSR